MPTPLLYTAKSGRKTWRVRFRLDGQSCSETFNHRREAEQFCSDVRTRDARYALAVMFDSKQKTSATLDQVAELFFAWKGELNRRTGKPLRVKSDRTVFDYRRDYINWIQPAIGFRAIHSIVEADVQKLVDHMTGFLSPKSVADRHAILYGIFAFALAPSRRIVTANPCIGTELPKRVKAPPKGMRPNEWKALRSMLAQINPDACDLADFMLATGWRFSEAVALSAADVEDNGVTVHVTMSRVVRRNAANRHVIVEDAKSQAGFRRVQLDADTANLVRRRAGDRSSGLVFTSASGRQWHYPNFLTRIWEPAVKASGLERRPTPHWLRHSHVGWMILGGHASLSEIQRRLGHASITTTNDVYGRLIEDVSADALAGFAAMRDGVVAAPDRVALTER